jgi:hypothetical protein
MKLTTVGLITIPALIGLALILTAVGPSKSVPPLETLVVPPATHVPPEVASLTGVWESLWGQGFPSRLVVEKIHPEWASIIYTWGDDPDGQFKAGWVRERAKVLPGGKLHCRYPGDFTFELSEDHTTLVGKSYWVGRADTIMMRRTHPILASVSTDHLPLPGSPE